MQIIETKLNQAGALAKRSKIDMIVLHHAATKHCTVYNINQWHLANGWSMIGYHYFINKKGEVFKGRPDDVIGSHAKGYNATSLGLCFEGDFEKEVPTQEQIEAGLELVSYLKKKYNIKKVKGHKDLMATSCPGTLFLMEKFAYEKENLILSFQRATTADGFRFKSYGLDGKFGSETESIMKKCVVKRRLFYKYKNATKLVQRLLGVNQDGLCGKETEAAIKNFQESNRLVADGCVGLATWKALLDIK
jgi:peptidoglycan hydrolase-like protein with peptidoglycan-binding domain